MPLWQVSTEAPRALIENAVAAFEEGGLPPPLSVSMFEAGKTAWRLDLLYAEEVDLARLSESLAAFDPDLTTLAFHQGPLPDENWVAKSLENLKPVRAGKFFVHGAHDAGKIPPGVIPICIEAGEAFGTGHHGTTEGCLAALSLTSEDRRPARVLDLGTGSGVLAIAAAKLWRAQVTASDIDPVAVKVARENTKVNGVQSLIRFIEATGTAHAGIRARAPYDLITANILARPLRKLAGDIAALLRPGGCLILSGILQDQAARVEAVYKGHRAPSQTRLTYGEWVTLICRKA